MKHWIPAKDKQS